MSGIAPETGSPKRALLLLNAKARSGGASIASTLDVLRRGGLVLIESKTEDRPFTDAIREHSSTVDFVILGGGDGTLNAAASALVETKLPLGILPLGTANWPAAGTGSMPISPSWRRLGSTAPLRSDLLLDHEVAVA